MCITSRPSCQQQQQPYPWLLYRHGEDYTETTFLKIGPHLERNHYHHQHSGDYCTVSVPGFGGKEVIASFQRWLLLLQTDGSEDDESSYWYCSLWSSFKSIDLPPLKLSDDENIEYYVLLEDGGDGNRNRKMLTLLLFERTVPCIYVYRRDNVGNGHWRQISYGKEIEAYYEQHNQYKIDYPQCLERPFCCNGKLYALTHFMTKLVEVEINIDNEHGLENSDVNNGLVITQLGCMPEPVNRSCGSGRFLVEVEGEIFWIIMVTGGIDYKEFIAFSVFKLNFSTWTWVRLDTLEERVLFDCSGTQGFGVNAEGGEGGNSIYFTMDDGKCLFCYHMEDNCISMSLPCTHLPTPAIPIWVMPGVVNQIADKLTTAQDNGSWLLESKQVQTEKSYGENCETEEETSNEVKEMTDVCDLSFDVLKLIAGKLIVFDYMNFREACTMFRHAAPPIQWRTVLTRSDLAIPTCLSDSWLVLPGNMTDCDKATWSLVDPHVIGSKYLMTTPKFLEDVTIQCSKDGWLLLSCCANQARIIFFNPFTRAMIQLPDLETMDGALIGFTFSSSPTSKDCITIAISEYTPNAHISIFASGMDDWDCIEFENNSVFWPNFNNPVFWNGAIYFLGNKGNLGVLKIHGEGSYDWEVLDNPKKPCNSFHQNFLVECGGELLSVFVGYMGKTVEVFKLSLSGLIWEKLDSLGNYVLYISRSTSFSTLAKSSGMENKIYFSRFRGESLVYYSLNTGKFHSVGSDDSFIDYCGTREQLLCGWIEPRWF